MRTKRQTKKQHTRKKKHKGGKSLKKLNCSPKPKDKLNHFSCYANDSLVLLRNKWNSRHPDVKIHSDNPKEIHSQLKTHLQNVCNNGLKSSHIFFQIQTKLIFAKNILSSFAQTY